MCSSERICAKQNRPGFPYLFTLVLTAVFLTVTAKAQTVTTTTSITDGRTPSGMQAGTPAGSYALSDFDNVSVYNGNLNFRLPLLNVGGRGSANMTITLALNLKSWHTKQTHKVMPDESTIDSYVPTQTGWLPYAGYGAGRLDGRNYGLQTSNNLSCRWYSQTLSRLTFSTADGTEYELRDQLTNGQPLSSSCTQGANRGTVFITADGTAATFVSDVPIFDNPTVNSFGPHGFTVSGFLMLKDGTRYRIDNGNVTWIRDRNGNKITFTYSSSSMTITDPLNRQVTVNYDVSDVAPYGLCDQIIFKGFGGTQRLLRVSHTSLANVLRPNSGYTIRTLGGASGLFPETNGSSSTTHNPIVTSAVWLPDGRNYKFYYNSYGELARVELPTGGAYEYDMTPGSGVICLGSCWPEDQREIYRRVVERRVYANGGSGSSFEQRAVYTNNEAVGSSTANVTVEQSSSTGTVVARSRHYFASSALNSLFGGEVAYAYGAWYDGKETQTEALSTTGDINTATVLRRSVTTYEQRTGLSWWPAHAATHGLDITKEPPNDPRIKQVVTTVEPAGANLVSQQVFGYDDLVPFNNQNNVKEYDFGVGTPGALLREIRTTFIRSASYVDAPVHIRQLASEVSVQDAQTTKRAKTTFEYDNYTLDGPNCAQSFHCGLQARSNISGLDSQFTPGYTTRGNLTATTRYLLTNGVDTGSVSSYSHFDVAGNIVRVIDARSTPANVIATNIEYDDRFGFPDNEARTNSIPSELIGFNSFALPTRVINSLGHTSYAQFDYYLGAPVNAEDVNGIVSSGYFNDLLDRPTQIRRGIGTSAENQTTFTYDDLNRTITTSTDRDANNLLISKLLYDPMGRTIEARQYEGGINYIVTETQYDPLGRAFKISNPYRRWLNETAVWTTQAFDALGRVISVTTPDNAVVSTTYSGKTVTVTDQAGKTRMSVSDALGRLVEVYEDPNGLNYQTTYTYDVLENVVKVTQGSQQRFFMYDSLKRLIRARNPEQATLGSLALSDPITGNTAWSIGYQYDANSNLTDKTDARGVVSTYAYDALNRNTTINYSDTTTINPDVTRYYDGATNGKGRFWTSYSGGDFSNGPNVDHMAVDSYDAMGRPLVQRQVFKFNNVWGAPYQTSRTYDLAGGVKSQTYPSGRSVTYNYDAAGRLGDKDAANLAFTGNLGDGLLRTYAKGITYSSWSTLSREQFGTSTAAYHNLHYNIRGQLCDVRASNSSDEWGGELGALVNYYSTSWAHCGSGTDNNGNVLKSQTIINSVYFEDRYTFDTLNRLTALSEFLNGSTPSGSQQYGYDRWGNRNIAPSSPALGFNTSFEKEDATNRLYAPGDLALTESARRIKYDAAGNQTRDTFTGYGDAFFDAENHITSIQDKFAGSSTYTYNADGQRTRRKINNQETWQIYGMGGELLAEYAATAAAASPQKEYGYRNGQLLITAAQASTTENVTWTSVVGATASGNSLTKTASTGWGNAGAASTRSLVSGDGYVEFSVGSLLTGMVALSHTDANQDYTSMEFALLPNSDGNLYVFESGVNCGVVSTYTTADRFRVAVEGGVVKYRKNGTLVYTSTVTPTYPLLADAGLYHNGGSFSNVVLSGNLGGGGVEINWLISDHLGTPRMIIDQTGTLANVKRHDYLPFGEELLVNRTAGLGYSGSDGVRQQFTGKERDNETGMDYFNARYYASVQGRFTSSDPILIAEQKLFDPQQWNMYSYTRNNPTVLLDPTGKYVCTDTKKCEQFEKARQEALKSKDADTVRAAKAYGDLSKEKGDKGDNGVYVSFADNVNGDRRGSVSRRDTGIEVDANSPNGLRATLNVTIKSDQAGNEEVIAHEGSHVADYQDFVNAIGADGSIDARADALNITSRQTETRAYLVSIGYAQRGNETLNFGPCGVTKECKFPPGMMPALRDQQIQDLLNSQYKNLDTRLWPEPAFKVTKP